MNVLASTGRSDQAAALMAIEDHDTTNQFSILGSLEPGLLRRWSMCLSALLGPPSVRSVPASATISASVAERLQGLASYAPGNLMLAGRAFATGYQTITI